MKTVNLLFLLCFTIVLGSCQTTTPSPNQEVAYQKLLENPNLKRAYFASGCFWCVEAVYESLNGVSESLSGYSGGHTQNPTYEDSNTGKTGHAEAVEIIYDPEIISFKSLVDVYFGSQNPTQVNGQGPDNGSQYRSIIFYSNKEEKQIITQKIKELNTELAPKKVGAEVMSFKKFWLGEAYHQNYERLHPNQGYIKAVSIPRLNLFKAKFPELLKESLKKTHETD